MIVKKCHVTAAFLFVFVLSCTADDSRVVASENAAAKDSLSTASAVNPVSATPPGASQPKSDPATPTKKALQSSTASSVRNETIIPDIKPTTVKPDPDNTNPTTASTEPPSPSTIPTKPTSPAPTTPSTTTVNPSPSPSPSPKPSPSTSSTSPTPSTPPTPAPSPSSTTPANNGSTAAPVTTAAPPHHSRQFDGPSFFGGIILASGLTAIGFLAFKFYKARTERNYHTL